MLGIGPPIVLTGTIRLMNHQDIERIATEQTSFLIRVAYFLLIGWWLSGLWMAVAWLLCVTIIGFPLGIMMVNRVPFVMTLHRGYA